MKKQFFRVKQLADQTFLRAEKSKTFDHEELQLADHKVEYLRTVLAAINKKLTPGGPNVELDKRLKKCLEYQLGVIFQEQGIRKRDTDSEWTTDCKLLSDVLKDAGSIEQQLAKEYAEHEIKVEDLVSQPIHRLLEEDFPNILKQKRNLAKYSLDKDSASSRYNATKKEALKDDLEEADTKVEQCRDNLAYDMFNLLSRENEIASFLLQLLKLQRGYHESALNILQAIIPQLEKKIGTSSVKRVFGIPLEEHLRVTGRHIAYPLEICITALNEIGAIEEEGLLRLPGSTSKVKRLKSAIDSGCFTAIISEYKDVHVIGSILKSYLRDLPEPLLTFHLYNEWMQIMHYPESQRIGAVKKALAKLPRENMENLTYLIQFLSKLSQNSANNKMCASNIAIVISPNLLWNLNNDASRSMGNCATIHMLIELFIKEAAVLFNEDVSQYITPVTISIEEDKHFKDAFTLNELSVSTENIQTMDSPKPNMRKKKAAPNPPNNIGKLDEEVVLDRLTMTASYPSGSSTLTRKQKDVRKTTIGTNTGNSPSLGRRSSFHNEENRNIVLGGEPKERTLVNNAKNVNHKYVTQQAASIHISKAVPVQPILPQSTAEDKKFTTCATYAINHNENIQTKPIVAPRSLTDGFDHRNMNLSRTSSVRSSVINDPILSNSSIDLLGDVQLRKPEMLDRFKPEIPARPASLQKRESLEMPLDLQKTQCSMYSVANKQQPSYVQLPNKSDKHQLGHDNQITEKEKFLGHHVKKVTPLPRHGVENKFSDINSNCSNPDRTMSLVECKPGLPPKCLNLKSSEKSINIKQCEKLHTTKSNEKLNDFSEKINGNHNKSSHNRTRSDGNLTDLGDISPSIFVKAPSSPRSLNKPTEPPPPPPISLSKPKSDGENSTDL